MNTVVIIGAGNVATHLAKQLHKIDYRILQIYSRTEESAKKLAQQVNADYTHNLENINNKADYYIFSIKDSALEHVIRNIPVKNGIWIHTAGSMPMNIFEGKIKKYGVLYPFQTFSKNKDIDWSNIPVFIESIDNRSHLLITAIADQLSEKVYTLSSEKRIYIHTSGVFACNFVNHMYELANRLVSEADLPFEILLPLISETCEKIHQMKPYDAQTGPAVRFDENVMNKQIELLKDERTRNIYKLISKSINDSYK